MTIKHKVTAVGATTILALGACVLSVAPAEAATKGTCSVSVHVWTNSDEEIISDATAVCKGAKAVSVRSRLYYCNWVMGGSRSYVVKDSKTAGRYSSFTGTKKVTVVEKAMYGKWYAEGYVWYTKKGLGYAKSDLQFASVGSRPDKSDC